MAGGYFSKELKKSFAKKIKTSENFFCKIKLSIGLCDFVELQTVCKYLFGINELLDKKKFYFISGQSFIKRFFILYDKMTGMFEPCFILLLLSTKSRIKSEIYKIRVSIYIRYLSLWCRLNKSFYENSVVVDQLENGMAEEIINEFLKKTTIEENSMIDEETLKTNCKNYPSVTLTGSFKSIKQRYLSAVER